MRYDYSCHTCKNVFEAEHKLSDSPPPCPSCGSILLKRLIAKGTTFKLKGGGWGSSGYSST